jgi:hypothetical protein
MKNNLAMQMVRPGDKWINVTGVAGLTPAFQSYK